MLFNFGLESTFLAIFVFHGLLFTGLLLGKGLASDTKPNIWLGLVTFTSVLYITPFFLGYAGWYSTVPFRDILFYFPFQQLLLLPPLLYFYIVTLLNRSFEFKPRHFIHFMPAGGYLVYSLIMFIGDKVLFDMPYFYADGRDRDFDLWYQVTGFVSLGIYLLLSLRVYIRYKRITYQVISFADQIMFPWVRRFLFAFITLLFMRLLFFYMNPEWAKFGSKFWYYLCFSILIYYISLNGYTNYLKSITLFNAPVFSGNDLHTVKQNGVPKTSDLYDLSELEIIRAKIELLMDTEKIYKDPKLTLAQLSQKVDTHIKKTSHTINSCFSMNFNDFINGYRCKEVIKILHSEQPNILTLLGIALDCGFNSKSTFNRVFKKQTGMSPKDYLKKIQNRNSPIS